MIETSTLLTATTSRTAITRPSLNGHYVKKKKNGVAAMTNPHVVTVSLRFILVSFGLSIFLAFSAGRMARVVMWKQPLSAFNSNFSIRENDSASSTTPVTRCQQLVVDMDGMDAGLLESKERLSNALVSLSRPVRHSCHALAGGVTCMGILSEGHVTFQTSWPGGVLSLDIMQCNDKSVVLDTVKQVFGAAAENNTVRWSIKKRGWRPEGFDDETDLENELAAPGRGVREVIASVQTPFQQIDIINDLDLATTNMMDYKKSLSDNDSYYSRHPELFAPGRSVFLNGVIQSTQHGDAAYHEALVHPAMFAHDFPERVAIIGGGEGATLREVLKHATVQQAIMIEIDEIMIDVSRKHLPEWSSCDNLVGSTESCFDEDRASVYTEDALAWFIDRFYAQDGQEVNAKGLENAEPMDVIIMDALDPQDFVDFCNALYDNDVFTKSLYNALSENGILVMQLGEAPRSYDPPESMSIHHHRADITEDLEQVGFESIHFYSEGNCDFEGVWTYLVAFKDYESRMNWYANEAEIELQMHKRAMRTKSGESPFLHFDGSTMLSYQTPHKVFETVFCREEPTPESCRSMPGIDLNKNNVPISSFEVKDSKAGDNAGRGLFTKVDIDANTYIAIEKGVESVFCSPSSFALITEFEEHKEADALGVFDAYLHGYGFEGDSRGGSQIYVDSSPMTFVNHGCNGTHNIGWRVDRVDRVRGLTEFSVNSEHYPEELISYANEETVFDPLVARHLRVDDGALLVSLRKIGAGEEILDNYLTMTSSEDDWEKDVRDLRAQCTGDGVGRVFEYEDSEL